MRKYPEIHVQWVPPSGIHHQEFEINVLGLMPSGVPYVSEILGPTQNEWRGSLPLWNKDGKVWNPKYTDDVHVSITSVNEIEGHDFKSKGASVVLTVKDLEWIPDAPTEVRAEVSPFLYPMSDDHLEDVETTVRGNLNILFSD